MIPCTLIKKRKGLSRFEVVLLMALAWPSASQATNIYYDVSNIGGSRWQYDYTVENDSLADPIQEFTIYFEWDLYENLIPIAAPAGWDPLVIQPDAGLYSDGFFDAVELGSGLSPGSTSGPFSVSFDYLGAGTPTLQRFDTYRDLNFTLFDSGFTSALAPPPPPPPPTGVSEPGMLAIMMLGLSLLANFIRRLRKSTPL